MTNELILPKKFPHNGSVRIIFPSSSLSSREESSFRLYISHFYRIFKHRVKVLRKSRRHPIIPHLAAPLDERKKFFLEAVVSGHFIIPALGGTGTADIIDSLTEKEIKFILKQRPIFCGFSDFSAFSNFIYFRGGLCNFCYVNAWNLFRTDKYKTFFDLIQGKINKLEYQSRFFRWLENKPVKNIQGKALGGTLTTLVHLLDRPEKLVEDWSSYILFLEDTEADLEDLHLAISSLKRRKVFEQIQCLVLGELSYHPVRGQLKDFPKRFAQKEAYINKVLISLLEDELEKRDQIGRPLPILKIHNFGHDIFKNNLILPIGAPTTVTPGKKIIFQGPFVK